MSTSNYKKKDWRCADHAVLSIKLEYFHCFLTGKYDNMLQVYYTKMGLSWCEKDFYTHLFVYWERVVTAFANTVLISREWKPILKCKDSFLFIYYEYVYVMSIFMNANILVGLYLRELLLERCFLFYALLLKMVKEQVCCRGNQQTGQEVTEGIKVKKRKWCLKEKIYKGYMNCLKGENKMFFEIRKKRKLNECAEQKRGVCKNCESKRVSNFEFVKVEKKKKKKKKNVCESRIIYKYNTCYKINISYKRRPLCVITVYTHLIRTVLEKREKKVPRKYLCMCYEKLNKNRKEKRSKKDDNIYKGNVSCVVHTLGKETSFFKRFLKEKKSVNYFRFVKKIICNKGIVKYNKTYNFRNHFLHKNANFRNIAKQILERRNWEVPLFRRERITLRWCVRRRRFKVHLFVDSGERHAVFQNKLKETNESGKGNGNGNENENENEERVAPHMLSNMCFDTPQSKKVKNQKFLLGKTYNLCLYKSRYIERCEELNTTSINYSKMNTFSNVVNVHRKQLIGKIVENEVARVSFFLIKEKRKGTLVLQRLYDYNHIIFFWKRQMKTDVSQVGFHFLLLQMKKNRTMKQEFFDYISSTFRNTEWIVFCASNYRKGSGELNNVLLYCHCEKAKNINQELSQTKGKQHIYANMRVKFEKRKIKIVKFNEYKKLYNQLIDQLSDQLIDELINELIKKGLYFSIPYVPIKSSGCIVHISVEKKRNKLTLQNPTKIRTVKLKSSRRKKKKLYIYITEMIFMWR